MLNKIWFWLLVIGLVYGFGKAAFYEYQGIEPPSLAQKAESSSSDSHAADGEGTDAAKFNAFHVVGKRLTDSTLEGANGAVKICLGLIGIMVLWLGMLNIAKEAGMMEAFAKLLSPVMRWLFPGVPDGHPAQGAMLMNISANMLGMGNAATPLGLNAMRELQTLNPTKETATNAMATFLAINTSSVTIVPMTIIAFRAANGSDNPAGPLAGIILTTFISTCVAIFTVRLLSRLPRFAMPTAAEEAAFDADDSSASLETSNENTNPESEG